MSQTACVDVHPLVTGDGRGGGAAALSAWRKIVLRFGISAA